MTNTPIDQPQRNRALDTVQSFAVSAPAGSGKTGLLTQRVLALLALCDEPENILAITFTRKAAAEMQHRILSALRDAQQTPQAPKEDFKKTTWQLAHKALQRDQERGWQLFSCPNRLRITTIDSLCRSISQQMPFESQLGDTPEILDDPNTAYQMAARETLALIDKNDTLQPHLKRLIEHVDNRLEFIEALLMRLLAKRDQWLGILLQTKDQRQLLEWMLQAVIEEHLRETSHNLAPVASELALLADHAASQLEASSSPIKHCLGITGLPDANHHNIQVWLGLRELLLTQKGEWRKSATKAIGFIAPSDKSLSKEEKATAQAFKQRFNGCLALCQEQPGLAHDLDQIRYLPSANYQEAQWQLLDSLNHILLVLASQLTVVFQQLGKTDYLAITLAALDALGEPENPTDLALALDYKIQHILVDEFQDTSTTQLQLLQRLTVGWQPNDGRTLFVVGDAMQSCYRFRDANVGIFLDVRKHGLGDIHLEALDLQVNFRSQQGVVDWVNHSFQTLFPEQNNSQRGAVRYSPSVGFNSALKIPAACAHLLCYSDTLPAQRLDEAQTITHLIQQTQANRPSDTIALLLRSKSQAQTIIPALQQAGIEFQANDIDRLNTCMPVLDVLSLSRALLHPYDRMAWLAVLRAPWCGLEMDDLLAVSQCLSIPSQHVQKRTLWHAMQYAVNHEEVNLSKQGRKNLSRFVASINMAMAEQQRKGLRQWIHGLWLHLGGPGLLLNPNDQQNVYTFFELLDNYEQGGIIPSWQELENAVNALFAKPHKRAQNTTQQEHAPAPVQIMSIHKSKGLEFDTVIIPGLEKRTRGNDQELILWLERLSQSQSNYQERQLLISPVHATGHERDPIYHFIGQQQQDKDQLENDRLLYVGCTRAIKQLHLVGYVQTADHEENTTLGLDTLKRPTSHSLLSRLWDSITVGDMTTCYLHAARQHDDTTGHKQATHDTLHPGKIVSLNPDWQAPPLDTHTLLAPYRGNNQLAKQSTSSKKLTSSQSQQDLFASHQNEQVLDEKPEQVRDNVATPDALQQREQRYIGTIIHLALEHITQTGYRLWDTARIEQQRLVWKTQLLQMGVNSMGIDAAIATVYRAVSNTLNDKIGPWLLDNTHPQSHTELAVWDKHGQHIIDRTFIEYDVEDKQQGTRWVIDYKSSEPNHGESVEEFITQQQGQYREQLKRYSVLFKEEKHRVRAALYFPLLSKLAEVK